MRPAIFARVVLHLCLGVWVSSFGVTKILYRIFSVPILRPHSCPVSVSIYLFLLSLLFLHGALCHHSNLVNSVPNFVYCIFATARRRRPDSAPHVVSRQLRASYLDLRDTIYCTLSLNSFYRVTRNWRTMLMDCIPGIFPQPCDHRLETSFIVEVLLSSSSFHHPIVMPELLIAQGLAHFEHFNDPPFECESPLRFHTTTCLMGPSSILSGCWRLLSLL
jgi:hypothetical protein